MTGRVLSVDAAARRCELSLKASDVSGTPLLTLAQLTPGETVRGVVKRVEPYGAFISLDGSALVGMCHISEVADGRVKDLAAKLKLGQRVRARILTADVETGRLSLGLKPSYFADAPEAGDGDAMEEDALADDGTEDAADGDAQMADESEEEEEAPAPPVRKAAAAKAAAAAAKAAAAATPKSAAKPAAKPAGPPDKAAVAQLMRDSRALFAADADGEDDELAFTWTVRPSKHPRSRRAHAFYCTDARAVCARRMCAA